MTDTATADAALADDGDTGATLVATDEPFGRRAEPFVVAGLVVFGTLLAWLRLPPVSQRTVWAEDGRFFLQNLIDHGPADTLFAPYAGYLQFLPRIMADLSLGLGGIHGYAVAINLMSCLIAGIVAGLVFVCARDVVPNIWLRTLLACITFLAPAMEYEVLGNAANIHWFVLWLTPWMLLYLPRTRLGTGLLAVAALAASLTEIQLAVFLPLLLFRFRSPRMWVVRSALLVGLIAQFIVTVTTPRLPALQSVRPGVTNIAHGYLYEAVLQLYPNRVGQVAQLISHHELVWAAAAAVPFLLALLVVLLRGTWVQRIAVIAVVGGSLVLWTAGIVVNRFSVAEPPALPILVVRYGVVPGMLLFSALVIAAQVCLRERGLAWRWAQWGFIVVAFVIAVNQITPTASARGNGPEWSTSLDRAAHSCEANPSLRRVSVVTAPLGAAAWRVSIPCDELVR